MATPLLIPHPPCSHLRTVWLPISIEQNCTVQVCVIHALLIATAMLASVLRFDSYESVPGNSPALYSDLVRFLSLQAKNARA